MFSKVRSTNTSPSPKHNIVMNASVSFVYDMHIDQDERHRLFRASSFKFDDVKLKKVNYKTYDMHYPRVSFCF